MSAQKTIDDLSRMIEEYVEAQAKQFGVPLKNHGEKLDKLEATSGELADRLDKFAEAMSKVDELTKAVEEVQRLRDGQGRAIDLVPDFDLDLLKHTGEDREENREVLHDFFGSKPMNDEVKRLQELNDQLLLTKAFCEAKGRKWTSDEMHDGVGGWGKWYASRSKNRKVRKWYREYTGLLGKYVPSAFLQKTFDTSEAGDGDDLFVEIMSSQLLRYLEVRGAIIPLFRSFALPGPLFRVPITTRANKATRVTEETTDLGAWPTLDAEVYSDANGPFDKIVFEVEKLRAYQGVTGELIEDSVVPIVAFITEEMGDAVRRGIEDAVINGDVNTGSPMDSDGTSTSSPRACWNGLRRVAFDNDAASGTMNAIAGAALAIGDIWTAKEALNRYGLLASNTTIVCGIKSYFKLVALANVETMQNFGARATLLTGALTQLTGSNVVTSEYMREDLNASGVYDGVTMTKTAILLVHQPSWWLGNWRGITLERDRVPQVDQDYVFAWWRGDFQKIRSSTEPTESVIYNM